MKCQRNRDGNIGIFARASCTRLSPKRNCPASSATRIFSVSCFFETATNSISSTARDALAAACATSFLTLSRLSAIASIPLSEETLPKRASRQRRTSLGDLAGRVAARPSPLEIVAAEPAGDVDHFADEIKSRDAARLHCFRRQLARIDAADGHFGFRITLRAAWSNRPLVNESHQVFQLRRPRLHERLFRRITRTPGGCKTRRPFAREQNLRTRFRITLWEEPIPTGPMRKQVKKNWLILSPVG